MTAALYATIWAALVLFVVAEAGRNRFADETGPAVWARPALILGALLVTAHVLLALAMRYGWNHDLAVRETARQAATVYGFEWRGNIYVSYAFVLLWFTEAWRWPGEPQRRASRSCTVTWAWRLFCFLVIANGAVVFATTSAGRLFGALLVAALLWVWWPQRAQGRRAGTPARA